jgi:hypothetical protein
MMWQQVSNLFSHFGFIAALAVMLICRASPAACAVFIKLAALWAILAGLGALVSAAMTVHEDHLFTADNWGNHSIRELILAGGCSALGVMLIGLGFALFKYQWINPHRSEHLS